jgi:hypothetical protein
MSLVASVGLQDWISGLPRVMWLSTCGYRGGVNSVGTIDDWMDDSIPFWMKTITAGE